MKDKTVKLLVDYIADLRSRLYGSDNAYTDEMRELIGDTSEPAPATIEGDDTASDGTTGKPKKGGA